MGTSSFNAAAGLALAVGLSQNTVELPFMATDWQVTVGGHAIPWTQIEVVFEQFHVPGTFAVQAPLEDIDVPLVLTDKAPEVVVKYKGREFFVGVLDNTAAKGDDGDQPADEPEDLITFTGRDLGGKLVKAKVVEAVPQNLTASELVKRYCRDVGLTDMSKVTGTTENVGYFIRHQYSTITQRLTKHDIIFDLAELEHFVFRVWKRLPFFGVQPSPSRTVDLTYRVDFNRYTWNKSHNNEDVKVKVLSWTAKKKRIASTAGEGSLVIQLVRPGLTAVQAKALANRVQEEAQRGLLALDISDLPGDASIDDVLVAFNVKGIAKGIDQTYWPRRIKHVITQDHHVMDLSLYNAKRITA